MIYATSNCTIEDAIRVVSQYKIGSWASVQHEDAVETFVIKTSDDETVVHKNVQFGMKDGDFCYMFNNKLYRADDFWIMLEGIYNLDPDEMIVVEEDELY